MNLKQKWSQVEINDVIEYFSRWEVGRIRIGCHHRDKSVIETYGLLYKSNEDFSKLINTNKNAIWCGLGDYYFQNIVLSEKGEIFVVFEQINKEIIYKYVSRIPIVENGVRKFAFTIFKDIKDGKFFAIWDFMGKRGIRINKGELVPLYYGYASGLVDMARQKKMFIKKNE